MIIDIASPKIKNCMELLNDKRFIDLIVKNSQMDRDHIEFIKKNLEYMLEVWKVEIVRGNGNGFLVDINPKDK